MTFRRKQKAIVSLFALSLLILSSFREPLVKHFPELSQFIPLATPTPDVKGENTSLVNIVRVVDGDTIVVAIGGKNEKVRLIGINSPESVDPRKPVECFGKEAKTYLTQILSGKYVRLEADPSQQNRDKYGRLLRYVFLDNGTFINQKMVADGYAFEYTYDLPYEYQTAFKNEEKNARENGKGLWNGSTCRGKK